MNKYYMKCFNLSAVKLMLVTYSTSDCMNDIDLKVFWLYFYNFDNIFLQITWNLCFDIVSVF